MNNKINKLVGVYLKWPCSQIFCDTAFQFSNDFSFLSKEKKMSSAYTQCS